MRWSGGSSVRTGRGAASPWEVLVEAARSTLGPAVGQLPKDAECTAPDAPIDAQESAG